MDIISILFDTVRIATFQPLPRPSAHGDPASAEPRPQEQTPHAGAAHCKSLLEASSTADGAQGPDDDRTIGRYHRPAAARA